MKEKIIQNISEYVDYLVKTKQYVSLKDLLYFLLLEVEEYEDKYLKIYYNRDEDSGVVETSNYRIYFYYDENNELEIDEIQRL